MSELMGDLLAYSRLTRSEIQSERLDLGVLLEEVLLSMANVLTESKARVDIEKPLPQVLANKVLLRQALTNLLSNAVKFAKAGVRAVVKIRTRRQGSIVRIFVEDNGIGIAPDDAKRLFQAFNRLKSAKDYSGTGLGLAIVRRAVERRGGRVGMEPGTPGGAVSGSNCRDPKQFDGDQVSGPAPHFRARRSVSRGPRPALLR